MYPKPVSHRHTIRRLRMKFDPKEIENAKIIEGRGGRKISVFASPITPRENFRRALRHEAMWMPSAFDKGGALNEIIPDNPARMRGGLDMFGIYWEFVPRAGGSIVRPGNPTLTDITKWREIIKFPDVDSWDWEGQVEAERQNLKEDQKFVFFTILTGYFERLISFMDFGPAAYTLMNRKVKQDVKDLMDALANLWIDIVDHVYKYYGDLVDGITLHDDWGAQDGPFFNERVVREMIVPYMRKVTDHIHSLGYVTNLHSCGKVEKLVPCMIEAGFDCWDGMAINDYHMLYELYGDKILMNVPANDYPADADEETKKEWAAKFVEEFANKNKPAALSFYNDPGFEFDSEIYRLTRLKFDNDN